MADIRILPQVLINRIAAGEVIERPASVVKELVENAIDAKATKIDVTLEDGGKNLIQVQDNGHGMTKNELELAIQHHATSKLPNDDLWHIHSFGFRGEALPSIGSIGRLSIASRSQGSDDAWSLTVEGGSLHPTKPSSLSGGTVVTLRDLFFATPARLKFLKTDRTEQQHVVTILEQLAMAHPTISFRLTSNTKPILHLPAQALNDATALMHRLQDILGGTFTENSVPVDQTRGENRIRGYISLPTLNKTTTASQYLFVNNRPVRDRLILGAIRAVYQDFLEKTRHPVIVLFMDIPSEEVDVNVHPTKAEVRFRDHQSIRGLIISAFKHALAEAGHKSASTNSAAALASFSPHP